MRIFLVLGLLGALAARSAARADEPAPRYAPAPAWVKPAPPETRQVAAAGAPLQLLLRDSQTRFGPAGVETFVETRFKLLTPASLPAGNLSLDWDPQVETMTIHRLTVTHEGKVTDVLAGQKFVVLRREANLENAMLDGRLTATLQAPGLQVGDIVDLAVTHTVNDPVLGGHLQYLDALPSAAVAGRLRVRATWPESAKLRWQTSPDIAKPVRSHAGGTEELLYEADGLPAQVATDDAPGRFNVRRLFEASDFASWKDTSALMAPLYEAAAILKPDSPLKAEAAKIRAATADPTQRALLALQLVQDKVRYVYVGLNSGAYRPAGADETWTRRFGDCKAKTVLLLALLNELGIKGEPVLVNALGADGIDQRAPQLTVFNHVMVHAVVDGQPLWLDGTRSGDTNLAELRVFYERWGLPLRAGGADLEHHLRDPAVTPYNEAVMEIDASAGLQAPAPVVARFTLRGDEAFAADRGLAAVAHDEAEQLLKKAFAEEYSWIEPKTVTWSYDPRTRLLAEEVHGVGKMDWSAGEGGGRSLWFEMDNGSFGAIKAIKRGAEQDQTAPFAVAYPVYDRWVTTIRLPASKVFDHQAETVDTTLGGIHYVRRTWATGDTVVMYRSQRSLKPEITAAEAAADEAKRPAFKPGAFWVTTRDAAPPAAVGAPPPTDAKGLLALAFRDADADRNDKALADLDKALAAKPGWEDALRARAALLARMGRYAESAETYAAVATALDKPNEALFRYRISALRSAGKIDEAAKLADEALAAFPQSIGVRQQRAGVFDDRRAYDKALAEIDAALRVSPKDSELLSLRAAQLWRLDRKPEAMAVYDLAMRANPDDARLFSNRAFYETEAGQFQAARDDLEEAIRMNPEDQAAVNRLSQVDLRQHRYAEAIRTLDDGLQHWPKATSLLNARCWARAASGDKLDLAARDCEAALALRSHYLAAMDSRAFVAFQQRKYAEAITRYSAVLVERPDFPDSLYGRGLAKLRAGDKAGGQADLAAATKLNPDTPAIYARLGLKP